MPIHQEFQIPSGLADEITPVELNVAEREQSEIALSSVEFDPILIKMANEIMAGRTARVEFPAPTQEPLIGAIVKFLRNF